MKKPVKREHEILIDGKQATDKEYKRLVTPVARPANKEDLGQKTIHSVHRGFTLLR